MQCIRINIRKATFILLTVLLNTVQYSDMSDNKVNIPNNNKENTKKINNNDTENDDVAEIANQQDIVLKCPSELSCKDLPVQCLDCKLNNSCIYGQMISTICHPKLQVKCTGERELQKTLMCRYCYQTEIWEHSCELKANCNSVSSPRVTYLTNCTVNEDIVCLGRRTFSKNIKCNWTGGYRWATALALSITLGGFGADRFYLGHWQEGIGKLFSFGGLGVWTIIDVILISLHYLGPADGSLYI